MSTQFIINPSPPTLQPSGNFSSLLSNITKNSTTITDLTPSTALVLDSEKKIESSVTTDIEISYVHGVTSNIQTQLDSKLDNIDVLGTNNQIDVNQSVGNVTISIAENPIIPGSGGIKWPSGTTAQRSSVAGSTRFNSETMVFEGTVDGVSWSTFSSTGTSISSVTASNPLASSGGANPNISLTGTISTTYGGTGLTSYTTGDIIYSSSTNTLSTLAGNTSTTKTYLSQIGDGVNSSAPSWSTGSALTKTDDTNVTLSLGGTPTYALLESVSIAAGWTGTLAPSRGGTGINNGTNTITVSGFPITLTTTALTNITFPTNGTLLTDSLVNGTIWIGDGSGVATSRTISGDATISNTGIVTLATSGVSSGSYSLANITVDTKGRVTAASNGSISNVSLTDGTLWIGNGLNIPTERTISGDATISNTGELILADNGVSSGSYTLTNLTVDSKGRITNVTNGTVPAGGSNTQLQYNNGGVLGGISTFITDGTDIHVASDSMVYIGDSDESVIYYDSLNNKMQFQTNTGSMLFYSDDATNPITFRLGSSDNNTAVRINNSSADKLFGLTGDGNLSLKGNFSRNVTVSTVNTVGNTTYTVSQLWGYYIRRDPNGADRTDVTDTSSNIVGAIDQPMVNSSISFVIENTADTYETITLTGGTGVTTIGTMTIKQGEIRNFLIIFTDVGIGTEAVTIYDIGLNDTFGNTLTNSNIYVGNSDNIATDVALSGDATLSNTGVLTLANSGVSSGSYTLTNLTVDSKGRITTANSTSPQALTTINDTNVTLTLGGTPTTALLQSSSITAGWSGQLSLARGGTNASLTPSNGGIFYSTATAGAILSGTGTAGRILRSGANSAPSWSTTTYPATTTTNQLLYSSTTNTISGLTTANNGVLITSGTGVPSISSTLPSAVQNNITSLGTISTGTWNGGIVSGTYGGTGVNNGTKTITLGGDLVTSGAFNSTFTMTNNTSVTFPTTGTLLNNSLADGTIYIGDGSGVATSRTVSGDATVSNTGVLTLSNSGVSAGTYGFPDEITVDVKGRITSTSTPSQSYMIQGTVGAPGLSYSTDTNTGIYYIGADNFGLTCGGTNVIDLTSSRVNIETSLHVPNGAASTPSYSFSSDTNTGIYLDSADTLGFSTGGTSRMNLGTTSLNMDSGIQILGTFGTIGAPSYAFNGDTSSGMYRPASNNIALVTNSTEKLNISTTNNTHVNNVHTFTRTGNIPSNFGMIYINSTGGSLGGPPASVVIDPANGVNDSLNFRWGSATTSVVDVRMLNSGGTTVGTIVHTGFNTSYNTTSDYRLKKDVNEMTDGLIIVNQLLPKTFKWIVDDSDYFGFLAHEVKSVIPQAVYGEQDEMLDETHINPQQIDHSKLIPYLTCAIQQLHKMVRNINTKTITNVGSGDVLLTAEQIMSGIIHGEPTGTRTWTLPSASDIIPLIFQPFVGQIISAVFNNDSPTKSAIIALGTGMTTNSGIFKINGHGTENTVSSLTLMFRLDNIELGTESITVFKN